MAELSYFISYRRSPDFEVASKIADQLTGILGQSRVFFDQDSESLPSGVSWPRTIIDRLLRADVVLAIVGVGWLQELRLRNLTENGDWQPGVQSSDWVRREIGFALQFGKRVLPVLINTANVPDATELPSDLTQLASIQAYRYGRVEEILDTVECEPEPVVPTALTPNDLPDPTTTVSEDLDGPEGHSWNPEIEKDSPHVMDYKYCITDARERHRLRVGLLAAQSINSYAGHLTFRDLQRGGQPRKYLTSSAKHGMFLQASCLVTDGMAGGPISKVLVSMRKSYQFHDPERRDPRFVQGESCLIASCMTSFKFHRNSAHLPNALLNDLKGHNPWAVFSRKLLVPDSVVDCRFLGIGFNLNNSDKEYLHLVWHVRTRMCPQMMLVPARDKPDHEVPYWVTLEELSLFDFEKAPIDRAVVQSVFGMKLNKTNSVSLSGFVKAPSLEGGALGISSPERWVRDTVPLDLCRMFQLAVHRGRISLLSSFCRDVLHTFMAFVGTLIAQDQIPVTVEEIEFPDAPPPFQFGVKLVVRDEAQEIVGSYLVLAAESLKSGLTSHTVRQIRERASMDIASNEAPTGVLVLNSVHTSERFELHGAISLHDPLRTPIHIIRISTGSSDIPVKRLCHAVIPAVYQDNGSLIDSLIVTRTGDERPRLPGGKIDGVETPTQALARELKEELYLEENEFEILQSFPPQSLFENSPSSSLLTHYQIHPFLIKVIETGVPKIVRQAISPQPTDACRIWATSLETWLQTGLGFDTSYPESLLPQMTPERLQDALFPQPLPNINS